MMHTIDLSKYLAGDAQEQAVTADELLQSLQSCGFVRIVNHGISSATVSELFDLSANFFQLPLEIKAKIANPPGPRPQRGWSCVGAESSASLYKKGLLGQKVIEKLPDAREHWDQGARTDLEFPNRWPDDDVLPNFRVIMERTYDQMGSVCAVIMSAMETAFRLRPGTFLNRITKSKSASELRLLHYPDIDIADMVQGRVGRIFPHYDLGVITLLFQDSVGGLEIENRLQADKFDPVDIGNQSDLIVNVSETLTRWTNGQLPAGLHRVSIPQPLQQSPNGRLPERYSVAYFCKADRNALVGPLKEFILDQQVHFEDMTAIQYHQQRLQSAY